MALLTNGKYHYLFALRHEYKIYINLQFKIVECDVQIEKMLPKKNDNDEGQKQNNL
ncbi:MAG: hypothetical protein H7296_10175 [Bacteroidia bacterium]|nr:hypothetical protein [Bacteroidia bacterium]